MFRLPVGSDLYEGISSFATSHNISAGTLIFLGAVRKAALRYYDQEAKAYHDFVIDRHLEILSGAGNLSLLDGEPFLHAHAAFADAEGKAYGGHLNVGTEVFICEVTIWELPGEPPRRQPDEMTGLAIWEGEA